MYSGNHSPCHPLDTLLQAASMLKDRPDIRFIFVGGGSERVKAKAFVEKQSLRNVGFLPYQPLSRLGEVLSSADLNVVVMGNPYIGIVHPCKIYNILSVGTPFLYIGPPESHIEDIIQNLGREGGAYSARHGDAASAVKGILEAQRKSASGNPCALRELGRRYSMAHLLPQIIGAMECSSEQGRKRALELNIITAEWNATQGDVRI
jgi:glycosyltransferase involved in cell wall biosynthesis